VIKFESLPDDILDRLPTVAALLSKREEVIFAYLFGGLARGSRSPLSDVDIAVFLERGRDGADARLFLFEALTEVLGTSELDLLILNTAPISIVGRVLQNRRILVDRDPFFRHRYE
jgi:predicted nucleotidyltransferase